jgi:hypothetical protein
MFKYRHSCYAWSAGFEGLCLTGIPYRSRIVRSRIVLVSFGPVSFGCRVWGVPVSCGWSWLSVLRVVGSVVVGST